MSAIEQFELVPGYTTPRLIKGGWQLSAGHSDTPKNSALDDMMVFVDAGITAFDCADIYTGVEELIGSFVTRLTNERGAQARAALKIQTKFVPDLDALPTMDRAQVTTIIERSLQRLQVERLDLVQFHWWDHTIPGREETGAMLVELQRAGKIDRLAGCNDDAENLGALVNSGFPAVSNQVQFSLLDQRPTAEAPVFKKIGTPLICYGVLAGGFLTERWLGATEPAEPLETRSHRKYLLVIEEFGGWALFQELLRTLDGIARRHGTGIANVATRWVLDQPGVAAAIIGARHTSQLADNLKTFDLALDDQDHAALNAVTSRRQGPAGPVFALERDREGPHGEIMAYNLNAGRR
ncbi:MAG: aldo/keto reductase [Alphaproteobacteria bacterium]|jgi:aryl-alcohol dehydrogenase-like predicted oxidoreductase|nr:aldo/keto reductase [Rhodospirillaceae bacterium]MBT6511004.1 aldo/keto reductase [Rhodospirillaceae bacterium]MDG2479405.1 aldo/keto reductase [Alphaproteobacteria bacterium]